MTCVPFRACECLKHTASFLVTSKPHIFDGLHMRLLEAVSSPPHSHYSLGYLTSYLKNIGGVQKQVVKAYDAKVATAYEELIQLQDKVRKQAMSLKCAREGGNRTEASKKLQMTHRQLQDYHAEFSLLKTMAPGTSLSLNFQTHSVSLTLSYWMTR